ncbi:MAG: hypothetical protein JKY93_00130 [Gammaproteobacteria bacterium]|nr:hypothetical protein [Gammaproteobacteria bacterium]
MRKRLVTFTLISIGGLFGLLIIAIMISLIFAVQPEEIKQINLIIDWMWYRIGFYLLVILMWFPLCVLSTRSRIKLSELDAQALEAFNKNREKELSYLKSQWFKVVIFLVFFEVVIIQQFGR